HMKKIILLVILVFVASCADKATKHETGKAVQPVIAGGKKDQAGPSPSKKETKEEELRRIIHEAEPIIENILASINKNDYKGYTRDFNEAMKSAYHDKGQFKKDNKKRKSKIGEPVARNVWKAEREYQYYVIYYWVKFSKIQDPVTMRLTVEQEQDGALKIAFLQYKSPALRE
ncbi:MAG: hypothetical protein WCQ99_17710, partial [Pseudomonadota bacterium]